MKKLTVLLLSVVMTSFIFSSVSAAEVKLGYVDMQKAITQTSAGKKARKQLEKEFKKRQAEFKKKEASLKKMSKDFEKKSLVLSDDVKRKKQQEFQREMLQFRETLGKSQMELQKRERDLTKPILDKLTGLLGDIAKKGKYTMILEKSEQSVLWAQKDADLTDQLIKAFEKKK